ncbi:MAG: CcdB family protein [Rhodobacteraceae bacterium]|nr:CcdB family protein [Paracoccaceae bacterium]
MEGLIRYDVAVFKGTAMVVVECDLLPPDPAVVVIPLLPDYPAVTQLNPMVRFDGQHLVLATRLIASVPRAALRKAGSIADQGDEVLRAIDILLTGV